MAAPRFHKWVAIVLPAILILAIHVGWWLSLNGPRTTYDSWKYIDGARSYAAGRGYMVRPHSSLDREVWVRNHTHPPGYSFLVFLVMGLGFSAYPAAVIVAAVSGALVIGLVAYILNLMNLPSHLAAVGLGAMVSMPSFVRICVTCWSETPCMLFSLASVAFTMLWSLRQWKPELCIWTAGLSGGLAWCIRNSSLSLLAAAFAFIVIHGAWQPWRRVARSAAIYYCGVLCGTIWLVVRNIQVFGAISPYRMPRSDVALLTNIERTMETLVADFMAFPLVRSLLGDRPTLWVILILLTVTGGLAAITAVRTLIDSLRERRVCHSAIVAVACEHRLTLFLVIYISAVLSLTVVAASVYKMDSINSRFVVPIYWAVWAVAALIASLWVQFSSATGRTVVTIIRVFLIASAPLQFAFQCTELNRYAQDRHERQEKISVAKRLASRAPPDQFILSDDVTDLRIHGGLAAVKFKNTTTIKSILEAGRKGTLWGIVIWKRDVLSRGK